MTEGSAVEGEVEKEKRKGDADDKPAEILPQSPSSGSATGQQLDERRRAETSWASYQDFVVNPGHKCPSCWLLREHCCCDGLPQGVTLRLRVSLVFHHLELGKHLGSNTAKLLLHFGADAFAWGVEDHDERLRRAIVDDLEGTVVLYPSESAVPAVDLVADGCTPPRHIVVLDGGWRECKRLNDWIDPSVRRCVVTTARREQFGGTRKYGDKASASTRVQTAAAFVALMEELGEDAEQVDAVTKGLSHYMSCWEAQIGRSKTWTA
mmetsp:Transcript_17744/g.40967  ORF Transcript_17744/g.40967 Transcript_17744/m.40967 type:complete len:265 (-) Transcript_17744:107-901(-)